MIAQKTDAKAAGGDDFSDAPALKGVFSPAEKTLAAQAYERLLDLIMTGAAKPGVFFTERRLAEQLSMSRTPLRDALLLLESEGLVMRLGARGVQVATMRIEEYAENLGVRRLLEPEATRIAAGRVPPETLVALKHRFELLLESGQAPERTEVRAADDALHSAITEAAGNARLAAIVQGLRRQTLMFDLRSLPERFGDTCREHLAIVAALTEGDGERAAQAMRDHLDAVRASIVARLARL